MSRNFPRVLWNPMFYYLPHKSSLRVPSWARSMQPTLFRPFFLRSLWILFSHLQLGLPNGLASLMIAHQSPVWTTRATCPTHLVLLDAISQIIFDENHRQSSSWTCALLQLPVWPKCSSCLTHSRTPSAFVLPLICGTKSHTRIKNMYNSKSVKFNLITVCARITDMRDYEIHTYFGWKTCKKRTIWKTGRRWQNNL